MRIVRIIGGLGNQMFQYALALSLQNRFPNEEVLIDKTGFNGYPLHDGFLLDKIFDIKLRTAKKNEIIKFNYPLFHYRLWQIGKKILPHLRSVYFEKSDMIFDDKVFSLTDTKAYYDGYWQSELYFVNYIDKIRRAFRFPKLDNRNKILLDELKGKRTVSMHIRRGDYISNPLYKGIADIEYYKKAVDYICTKKAVDCFVIFSNDIDWCKSRIPSIVLNKDCKFVDWNKGKECFRDMQIMSLCDHNIIANSSFSWWGAWLNLNKEKIVIAPHKWVNKDCKSDIIPASWIKIQ